MDIVDALLRAGYFEQAIGQEMNIARFRGQYFADAERINELTGNTQALCELRRRVWDTKKRLLDDRRGLRSNRV